MGEIPRQISNLLEKISDEIFKAQYFPRIKLEAMVPFFVAMRTQLREQYDEFKSQNPYKKKSEKDAYSKDVRDLKKILDKLDFERELKQEHLVRLADAVELFMSFYTNRDREPLMHDDEDWREFADDYRRIYRMFPK